MNFAKLSNMKKWLIILCGTESISKNVQTLSFKLIDIQDFEPWNLDQKWALSDFLKFITEMKNGILFNLCEESSSGNVHVAPKGIS